MLPHVVSEQRAYVAFEGSELVHRNIPENLVLQRIVAVGKHVSQANDLVCVCDLIRKIRMLSLQASHRLSNDLQLTFDDELESTVGSEVLDRFLVTKSVKLVDRLKDILEELLRIMPHR